MALSEAEATALVEQLEDDAATLHAIVHGGADAVVPTEGGNVKSAAKAIADMEAELDAALDDATGAVGASVVKAEEWAEKAEDAEVEPGKYSAKHWAAKAEEIRDSMTNVLELKGEFDASGGSFPADPDIGDYWIVTVDGTIGAVDLFAGDEIVYGPSGWIVQGRNQSANEILTKLKTVDGAGCGLDADKLDGQEGAYYAAADAVSAALADKANTADVTSALNGKVNDPGENGIVLRTGADGASAALAYDEGEVTEPTIAFFTTPATTLTYNSRSIKWRKIGTRVDCKIDIDFTLTNKGPAAGPILIGGLPFSSAAAAAGALWMVGNNGTQAGPAYPAGRTHLMLQLNAVSSVALIAATGSSTQPVNLAASELTNGHRYLIRGTLSYDVSA
ncbi:hypothetical protein [Parvibaculum sp.]|uniref:hypothetical protein n=1 Tax=Parvibaculum sp. TaxID=2024848 RepID=UPI00391D5F2A